jgi:type II secretory pathway pseudopilin PulG
MKLKINFTIGNRQRGITIIEMLVGIFIFSLIMTGLLDLFNIQLQAQRKILKEASLLNNLSYSLEYMSRALRMARRDDGTCISDGYTFQQIGNGIKFKNYKGQCQYFYLEDGILKEQINTNPSVSLTPFDIEVEELNIYLSGQNKTDDYQPKATISFRVKIRSLNPIYQNPIQIQTTLSARNLDVK